MQWVDDHGGQVYPGVNVGLDPGTHFERDAAFVGPDRPYADVLATNEPPDIVVEVSSPSTKRYDHGVKRDRYARDGAPEFWSVDLDADTMSVSVLAGDRYGEPAVYRRGDVIRTDQAPGLLIEVDDILRDPR